MLRFLNICGSVMLAPFRFLSLFLDGTLPQSVMNVNVTHVLRRQLEHQCRWPPALILEVSHIRTVTVPCVNHATTSIDVRRGSYARQL